MLEIKNVTKEYVTDNFRQKALDNISISFRSNEFAAILGHSGSGKTTFLNIVGGLDRYDKGDLIVNEVSTKKYKDKDWDTYRNHRVGFVFQNYNLITHQSVLRNVELALTLSGISKTERKKRAKNALKEVGLEKHINKRPNQLSGGQMQRVAIARAIVNDPEILLADEPTGALDSATSTQIMDILKEIAKDRLVIMVTHNPELAEKYANRIIKLKDGKIVDDSNPYDGKIDTKEDAPNKKNKKTSMNLLTALGLSLNNLMTKKGRTILTAFAGSIGIIGIALILSMSNGVQRYIDKTERDTLAGYPIQILKKTVDLNSIIEKSQNASNSSKNECKKNRICTTDDVSVHPAITLNTNTTENNLKEFKKYLENNGGNINKYITDISYQYALDLQIYSTNHDKITKVNPNTLILGEQRNDYQNTVMEGYVSTNYFNEMLDNDKLLASQFNVLKGRLPKKFNELVLIVNKDSQIPLSLMYALGIEDREDLNEDIQKIKDNKKENFESIQYKYDDIVGTEFKLVLNTDYYQKQGNVWINKENDKNFLKDIVNNGITLEIVGVVKVDEESPELSSGYIGYTEKLTSYVIDKINEQNIVKEQKNNKNTSVITGMPFDKELMTYENSLLMLGVVDKENPSGINIFPKDFDSKEKIEDIITKYNKTQTKNDKKENVIIYNDMIGILLSSVTSIVNIISYVLIAFVAVSLIVSSIMIAIITYISVLERTKEIGILRSIGASKKDIRRVFNAETIIEGAIAGLLGVGVAYLITIPANAIIKQTLNVSDLTHLPLIPAIVLVIISIVLTLIAGLIPANIASKKDPVEALRSE